MRTRRARPEDLVAIGELTVAAYAEFSDQSSDGYADRLRDAAARDREAELWVATSEGTGEILGTVTVCQPGSPWREVALEGEGEFRMLAVSPTARGLGVGTALLQVVVEHFRRQGASRIVMSTLPRMQAARRIYERGGFVRLPARDWSAGMGIDLITYALELAPAPGSGTQT